MKTKYLAFSQASVISSDYQHLVGQPFGKDEAGNRVINAVTVAPYSRILQWSFVRQLVKGSTLQDALSLCRDHRYDVIAISVNPDSHSDFKVKDLRSYLLEHQLPFNAAGYRCQYAGISA